MFQHGSHHHRFTSIVHTKARVRRYQQLTYSIKAYSAHLPFLTYNLSCPPSHTPSMSFSASLSLHRPPTTSKFLHLETQSSASLRSTCPNHLSLPRLATRSTPTIPSPRLSSSLDLLSFRVTPHIHLTMLFSHKPLHIIHFNRPSFATIHKHPL